MPLTVCAVYNSRFSRFLDTLSLYFSIGIDALWCTVSDGVITLSFIGRFIVFFIAKRLVVSTSVLLAAAAMSVKRVTMTVSPFGYAYSRDCLLSAYSPASPTFSVRQHIHELGLWTVCRLIDSRRRGIAYARSYRSRRAGCCRPVLTLTPVGNGACTVVCLRRPVVQSAVLSHVR